MGTYGSAVTSWRMISSGKRGANASGPTGFLVAGLRGGSNWKGKSGTMLYQISGNDLSSSRNFVDSIPGLLFCRQLIISLQALASKGRRSQPPRQVSGPQRYRRADLPINPSRLTSPGIRAPELRGCEAARASRALAGPG